MKGGAENRTKTVTLGILVAVALCGILYNLYSVFGPSNTPPPAVAPLTTAPAPVVRSGSSTSGGRAPGSAPAAGVNAQKLASTAAGYDPTLDSAAMLRAESLVYTGSGRNIFSATYTPLAAPVLPKNVPSPRPIQHTGPPPPPPGPPPPPPIPLRFFGTAQRQGGVRQIFLLSGEDVYLAKAGDIVAKRFKVDQVYPTSVQVTDMLSNNTQTLPLQVQ